MYRYLLCLAMTFGVFASTSCYPRVSAQERVSGLHELVVIPSDEAENGRPTVRLRDDYDQGMQIEVKPNLHVHPNFYSGKKEFQGPIIVAGPAMIIANHPDTGEPSYIRTNLPGGSPLVIHQPRSITYIFEEKQVVVSFPRRNPEAAVVRHINNRRWGRESAEHLGQVVSGVQTRMGNSQTVTAFKDGLAQGGGVIRGTVHSIDKIGGNLIGGFQGLANGLPLPKLNREQAEGAATGARNRLNSNR